MNKTVKILACLAFMVMVFGVKAQKCLPGDEGWAGGVRIHHINGVNTSYLEAGENIIRLREAVPMYWGANAEEVQVRRLYNPTAPYISDLMESFRQFEEADSRFKDRFDIFVRVALFSDDLAQNAGSPVWASGEMLRSMIRSTMRLLSGSPAFDPKPTLEMMRLRLRQDIFEGKKLILLPHSQGNFFANELVDLLKPDLDRFDAQGSLKVVHVAPPTPTKGRPYVRNEFDLILDLVEVSLKAANANPESLPPPANATDGIPRFSIAEHSFTGAYLQPPYSTKNLPADRRTATSLTLRYLAEALGELRGHPCDFSRFESASLEISTSPNALARYMVFNPITDFTPITAFDDAERAGCWSTPIKGLGGASNLFRVSTTAGPMISSVPYLSSYVVSSPVSSSACGSYLHYEVFQRETNPPRIKARIFIGKSATAASPDGSSFEPVRLRFGTSSADTQNLDPFPEENATCFSDVKVGGTLHNLDNYYSSGALRCRLVLNFRRS